MKKSLLFLLLALMPMQARSATLTVGSGGQHATVQAAVDAASPGDIIELINDGGTYDGNVVIAKANLTIRGKAGLTKKPVITSTGTFAWPDGNVISVQSGSEGLKVDNLVLNGGKNNFATVRVFSGNNGAGVAFSNCQLIGPAIGDGDDNWDAGLFIYPNNTVTVDNCQFGDGRYQIRVMDPTFNNGPIDTDTSPVNLTITNTVMRHTTGSGRNIDWYTNGSLTIDKSILLHAAGDPRNIWFWNGPIGPTNLTMTNSIIGADPFQDSGSTDGAIIWQYGDGMDAKHNATIRNCDFLGGNSGSSTHNALVFVDSVGNFSVKDCIFTGFNRFWWIGLAAETAPGIFAQNPGAEDYNVYAKAAVYADSISTNDIDSANPQGNPSQVFTVGAHSVNLADGQSLYTDRAKGDLRLKADSPVKSLNSTGNPSYPGSNLIIPDPAASADTTKTVTVAPTGADYPTVKDALAGVNPGDVIEIIDNSAPYVGNLTIDKKVTIRGRESLNPRPTLTGTMDPVSGVNGQLLSFAAGASNGSTFENLILDGQNTSICVAGWSGGKDLTFKNCQILGPTSDAGQNGYSHSITVVFWFPGVLMDRCEIIGGQRQCVTEGGGAAGRQTYSHCIMRGARSYAVGVIPSVAREVVLDHCIISQASTGNMVIVDGADHTLRMNYCLLRPDAQSGQAPASGMIAVASTATAGTVVTADHCDFIGANTENAFDLAGGMTQVQVTRSIFTGFTRYWKVSGAASGNQTFLDGCEDYNVYESTVANNIASADADNSANVYKAGAHSVNLKASDPLYLDKANGDFHLAAGTPAVFSTNVGDFAGSQGTTVPVELSSFTIE